MYFAIVTTFADKTKRRVMMLRSRSTLRPMKTGPDARLGRNGLRLSAAVMFAELSLVSLDIG